MLSHRGEDVEAITATSNSCEALQTWSGVHRMETGNKSQERSLQDGDIWAQPEIQAGAHLVRGTARRAKTTRCFQVVSGPSGSRTGGQRGTDSRLGCQEDWTLSTTESYWAPPPPPPQLHLHFQVTKIGYIEWHDGMLPTELQLLIQLLPKSAATNLSLPKALPALC